MQDLTATNMTLTNFVLERIVIGDLINVTGPRIPSKDYLSCWGLGAGARTWADWGWKKHIKKHDFYDWVSFCDLLLVVASFFFCVCVCVFVFRFHIVTSQKMNQFPTIHGIWMDRHSYRFYSFVCIFNATIELNRSVCCPICFLKLLPRQRQEMAKLFYMK